MKNRIVTLKYRVPNKEMSSVEFVALTEQLQVMLTEIDGLKEMPSEPPKDKNSFGESLLWFRNMVATLQRAERIMARLYENLP